MCWSASYPFVDAGMNYRASDRETLFYSEDQEKNMPPHSPWRRLREIMLRCLFVGGPTLLLIGISIAAFIHLQRNDRKATEKRFHSRAREIALDIERTFASYADHIESMQRYMNSSENVEQAEFYTFVSHSLVRLTGIESVHWAPVDEDSPGRTAFKIAYTEPESATGKLNPEALRVDYDVLASGRKFRVYSRIAETSSTPNQEPGSNPLSLVVFAPVSNQSNSQLFAEDVTTELRGFVIGVINVAEMTESVLSEKEDAEFYLNVTDEADGKSLVLFENQSAPTNAVTTDDSLKHDVYTVVGGRRWRLRFQTNPHFESANRATRPYLVFFSGILLSLAVGAFLFNYTNRTEMLERLVQERTTDLQQANLQLESSASELSGLNHALTQSNTELQQYAYVASHDLQSPLRAIKGYSQMLQEDFQERLDELGNGYIANILNGVGRMQGMIRDLLDYSRVESHGRPAEVADLNEVAEDAVALLSAAIDEENAAFHIHPLPSVACDSRQIVQLLQNLIGNGIKYRGENDPVVHVSAERGDNEWIFEVRDNGIGIDPANHEHVFDIFRRLHSAGEYPGTGIGLAVCRRIVQRHQGRIWIESELGAGSRFFFTIPDQAEEAVEKVIEPELFVHA